MFGFLNAGNLATNRKSFGLSTQEGLSNMGLGLSPFNMHGFPGFTLNSDPMVIFTG
jgi:hypothetical protein